MRRRPLMWFVISLLCFAGALYCWRWANEREARKKVAPASVGQDAQTNQEPRPASHSTISASSSPLVLLSQPQPATTTTRATNWLGYRLKNTSKSAGQLLRDDRAILLENAIIDTTQPLGFSIPDHLRAAGDPGSYIVQARGAVDDRFRAALSAAGAKIVSYIPNNAYLVRVSQNGAQQMAGSAQAVIPFEPPYKLKTELLKLAMDAQPLPEGTVLNVMVFADALEETRTEFTKRGVEVLAESASPFGPVLTVRPVPEAWFDLARLPGVEVMELSRSRIPANDLSRVRIGVAVDSQTQTNYLGLTGSNVVVNLNDTGVSMNHPDLIDRVLVDVPTSGVDSNGHGTHVAGIIAGDGTQSTTVTNARGSINPGTNFQYRGKAPGARIFSIASGLGSPSPSDAYIQERAARTNAFISNNSWNYGGDNTYSIGAANYDAATRDALPGVTGSQPLLFVFPAGNVGPPLSGDDSGQGGEPETIFSPATAKNVITVGAIEQPRDITNAVDFDLSTTNDTPQAVWQGMTSSPNEVAAFSSRGNVGIGVEGDFGRYKPDLVAPGTFVVSTRSLEWDERAYYNPTSHIVDVLDLVILTNRSFTNLVSVPNNAVGLTIRLVPNQDSPVPFPGLPIFMRQDAPPADTDPVATNLFSIPGQIAALNPVGTPWFYRISNITTQNVALSIITDIVVTNELGNYLEVYSNLNNSISGQAPHYYRYESGTSMSAGDVSGTLALMQEFFERRMTPPVTNSPALYKALLINGARSLPPPYDLQVQKGTPNFQGWGLLNLPNSLPISITNGLSPTGPSSTKIFDQSPTNALATGQSQTRLLNVGDVARNNLPLRITLVWTDPPGNPTAGVKLVNDLDLIVTNLDTGDVFLGNDIQTGAFNLAPWDTNGPPNVDAINNVENVYMIPPLGSNYAVTVFARHVNVNAVTAHTNGTVQDYALVISCGDGEVPNALTLGPPQPIVSTNQLTVGTVTNSFLNNPLFAGSLLTGQRVGANTPLLGTTNGMTNQWHFYVITNTSTFANAAFVTFLPPTMAIPRMGVFDNDPDNATRVEADIDLYSSLNPGLTNLDPAVIASCVIGNGNDRASRGRGGTEFVVYTNSRPGDVYYVGVKAEDQMAAEYIFLGVFSLNPFSQRDTNGNLIVVGLPLPAEVPDGSPADPGVALVLGLAIEPVPVRRVVVTNSFYHENPGDLVGTLVHNQRFAVLNNHRGGLPGFYTFIYEDNGEGNVPFSQRTDGPGSLRDFVGESGFGVWMLAMQDNSDANTGRVDFLTLQLEPQNVNSNGTTRAVQPNTFTYDFIDVPAGATNLTVCVGNNSQPVELYILRGDFPTRTVFDYANTNVPGGGTCLTITPFDVPPLTPGRYYIGVFNSSGVVQNIRIFASVILNPASIASGASSRVGPVTILDDAVTYATLDVTNHLIISDLDVGLLIRHDRISDLAITLISPSGTRVLLFENRGMASADGLGTFSITTNALGAVGLQVTNTLWFYTNGFEASPVGLYAPGAMFEGWSVLTNMVAVYPDFSDLCGTNKLLVLGDGVVSNTLPTTNSTSFNLSFQVTHAPYLVGTVGWWPMDGDARDIFGGLDGILCCNVGFNTGKVGPAYYGDGIATSMKVPRCRELDLGRGRGFSIEGWVRPTNIFRGGPLVEWNDFANDPTNQFPQGVQLWQANQLLNNGGLGSLTAVIWDTNSAPHYITAGPFVLTNALPNSPTNSLTNGWQHVALTFEAGSGTARLYVNGLLANSLGLGTFVPKTWGDLYFGYHPTGTNTGTAFAGGLDEFGVYNRALSDCEILAIFNANYRGKYGTNALTCPVALEVTLANAAMGAITTIFTNGLSWTNGPRWETDTITNIIDLPQLATPNGPATNFTRLTVRPLNPNVAVDNFALSAFVTNVLSGLLHFTEDTNLAVTPIKFAMAPYTMTNFPPTLVFSNDFENATQGVYTVGATIPGGINSPTVGVRDWTVVAGPITVISNASFAGVDSNFVALAGGAVQCELPTAAGHRYELSYTVRGPCAVGWWPGDIEPLSQRAQDLISGNHGAFINTATNTGAGFVVTPRGANALSFAGMINPTNQIATKIELGDAPQLQLTNALTIESWVRPIPHTNLMTQQLFFRGDSRNCLDPYYLALEPSTTGPDRYRLRFHIEESDSFNCGLNVVAELPDDEILADQWQHVAAVFESDVAWTTNPPWRTNELRLYIDGRRVTNLFVNGVGPVANVYTGRSPARDLDSAFSPGVAIGNRSRYDNSQPFRGRIDELTVYERALTDPEIVAIHAADRAGKADLSVPPAASLAKVSVSLDNVLLDVGYGDNAGWTTRKVVFTARGTNMDLKLQSNLPGTLIDAVTLTELPAELNFLPEETLAALNGEDAFGTWRLEILDTRAGATNNNPQLLEWVLNFRLVPSNPLPTIYLDHGIPYSGVLPAGGVQYFVADVPQWAVRATNVLQNSSLPVRVLFNQTNFPGNQVLIGPGLTGTNILATNTTPPLVIGQPYYLAVTNENAQPVSFSLGVWYDITTLANCQPTTNFVALAGIPRYFQFDVPTNDVPPGFPPREATFRLSGAESNVTVVLSQHLPLPNLAYADYISRQPSTNNEIILVMTNTTPFPLQTNRWYVGVFNTTPTNVYFAAEACYDALNPAFIPLTNAVPYDAAFTNQYVAPPGPPRTFFFTFEITNFVDAVLFELYGLSGDADLVLERDVPPGMAPYFARSSRTETWAEQIVLRTDFELPDLRGKWYVGVYNNELTNVAYTIRASVPTNGLLVSGQTIVVTNTALPPSSRLLSWNSVAGERYFVQFSTDGVTWTTLGIVVATTPCATMAVPDVPGRIYRVVQVPQFSTIPLPVYVPFTNSVDTGLITTFSVDVPSWASFATNSLLFADGPVNLLFNQFVRPTGAGGDTTLLANSTVGIVTLETNGTPQLLPGQRYYLGVENLTPLPVNFALQVDFNYTELSNGVPINSVADSPALQRYFYFDVSSNATAVAFQLFNMNGNADLVARKGLPLPTTLSFDYGSFNGGNAREDIILFTNSAPVPLSAGRWYLGVYGASPAPVAYTIRALEFTNQFPPIITLTNAIPYFNTNSGVGNTTDFYRFVVSTNAARAQFEINGPSGDMTLVARKGLPLPGLALFDYISANPTTNDELIVVFTNSTPVPLSSGDWFLSAVNVSGGPVSYAIKATEWLVTGQPIIITNSAVVTNSFCLTWTSLPGVHYHVDGLTSLNSTNWVTVSPIITATDVLTTWCLPLPSQYHFFRVVEGLGLGASVLPSTTIFTSITRTGGGVLLQWTGPTNATYQVQWTPTLSPPAWTTFTGTVTSPTTQFQFLDDGTQTGGLGPTRFYRLIRL